jgi:hypothetical protein
MPLKMRISQVDVLRGCAVGEGDILSVQKYEVLRCLRGVMAFFEMVWICYVSHMSHMPHMLHILLYVSLCIMGDV